MLQNIHKLTIFLWKKFPVCMYLFKVNNKSTRAMYEKYSKPVSFRQHPYMDILALHISSALPNFIQHFFWQFFPNDTWNKHKNKLMRKSYFFMFWRLQNNVTASFITNTFIWHTRLKFEIIAASCIKWISKKNMKDLLNKEHCCHKICTSLTKKNVLTPFYRPSMDKASSPNPHPIWITLYFYKKNLILIPISISFWKSQLFYK